jgi:hypothetical protein
MRDKAERRPGSMNPAATRSASEKLRRAGTRNEMQVPGDAKQPSTACTRLRHLEAGVNKGHRIGQNPQFDIFVWLT